MAAPILSATAELEVAGGHDDNMFLAASPDGLGTLVREGGPYASVAPAIGGDLAAAGFRLRLLYLGDFRAAETVGRLDSHLAELRTYFPAWRSVRFHVAAHAGAFFATESPQDEYLHAGGEFGFRWAVTDAFAATLAARAEVRSLAAVAGVRAKDWLLMPAVRLPIQATPWLELAPAGSAVFISPLSTTSTSPSDFRRFRGGLDATATAGPVTFAAAGWAGAIAVADRSESHLGGSLQATFALGRAVDLFARGEWTGPVSAGASQNYARRVALLGLSGRVMAKNSAPRRPSAARDLRPRVDGSRVRFRVEAAGATTVTVVGSWNDWATPGDALTASEAGIWEASLALPPGAHRYHFLVDGQPRRPPEAPRYVADDFGSDDGVIDVGGGAPASEQNHPNNAGGNAARANFGGRQ
ncbi:MAG TPA: glycogen-binding domain-containing protein [Polyangia bacterium]